jgi:signal peptidase
MNDVVERLLELVVVAALVVVFAGFVTGQPVLVAFVETGSMAPTLEPGDGFVAVPTPLAGSVDEGDVVTFRGRDGRLTTHRVVGETDDGFVTRGDANAFTDQQAGDRPVSRDRIVAVAWAPGGDALVLPGVGGVAEGARGVVAVAARTVGLSADPSRLAAVAFVVTATAFVLDELLADADGQRSTTRQVGRADGLAVSRVVVAAVAVALVASLAAMLVASGAATVPYDSVDPGESGAGSGGGIPAGESRTVSMTTSNDGVLPMIVVLDAPGERAQLADDAVVLAPRANATTNVSITAPAEPGRYGATVARSQYLGVLPAGVVRTLHGVNAWLARFAVALVPAVATLALARLFVGRLRGRLRLQEERPVPVAVSLRRTLRRLYR